MFITDSPPGEAYPPHIWFLDLEIDNNYQADVDYIDRLNLREFVLEHKLFVNEDTHILKF
jgi:hypothetical protein